MTTKDLHKQPFLEETITKLEMKISYTGLHNISYNKCYKSKEIKKFKVL